MPEEKKVRVAIYTRVSTEDQAKEGFSLDAQLERLRSYCNARNWEIAKEYVDDGHSGRTTKRPAYQKMMEEKELWDIILVVKMDRIHRNSRNFMEMMDNLRKWNKEFASMQESLDTSTAMGRFVVDIIQRIAQLESEQIGERVYIGMEQKARTVGGILGFNIPYGYDYKDGKLIVNEKEAKVVKEIFGMYLGGKSMEEIVKELNKNKILSKKGKKWVKSRIWAMLKNPIYCGYMDWNGILMKGEHSSLIDIKTYNEIQNIAYNKIKGNRSKKEPPRLIEVEK